MLSLSLYSCKTETTTNVKDTATKTEMSKTNTEKPKFKNEAHEMVYSFVQKVGNNDKLKALRDVVYDYKYQTPDGRSDISKEMYIFDGELSYGKYKVPSRMYSDLEGTIEQGYDGGNYWLKHNGEDLTDEKLLGMVAFIRPTNFYWFTMYPKLLDPNVKYESAGQMTKNGNDYNVVKVSFNSSGDKPTDIYQLYINKKTQLVDFFLFTVADFGVLETPFLMEVEYEKVDGLMIPSKRKYRASTWQAEDNDKPWTTAEWSNIKFNNNIDKGLFSKS